MRIIKAFPPNWPAIAAAFPQIKGKQGILYAYGDRIFNPSGGVVAPWLVRHEEVHGLRQEALDDPDTSCAWPVGGITKWWTRYIQNPSFRLNEEILAHRAEWQHYSGPYPDRYLGMMAERLSGPLYGNLISVEQAVKEITHVEEKA